MKNSPLSNAIKATTADRLAQIMKERKLTQVELLALCQPYCKKYNVKIGRSSLSQYCNGQFLPKQDKLTVLALALNVSESWLMGFDVNIDREEHTPINNQDAHMQTEDSMTIGERIKKIRLEKGISQTDLANAIGISKQGIHKYETGIVTNIPIERIGAIADYLGVAPAEITGWQDIVKEISQLPQDVQEIVTLCQQNPALATALLNLAHTLSTGKAAPAKSPEE